MSAVPPSSIASSVKPNARTANPWGDRRVSPRRAFAKGVAVIPILLDSSPGTLQWASGVDFSANGLAFNVSNPAPYSTNAVVIGIETGDNCRRFATLVIDDQSLDDRSLRVGGHWASGGPDDLLASERLQPRIDPRTLQFVHGCPDEALQKWSDIGVIRPFVVDRVLVCACCRGMPSWRNGCYVCGSGRVSCDRLLHHFACAHVDRAVEFETASGLQCPKCRTASLIVGSDFEYIDGPTFCLDCKATGGQLSLAALCHVCHCRFGLDEALELSLYAYHVERLDPLALVAND